MYYVYLMCYVLVVHLRVTIVHIWVSTDQQDQGYTDMFVPVCACVWMCD